MEIAVTFPLAEVTGVVVALVGALSFGMKLGKLQEQRTRERDPQLKITSWSRYPVNAMSVFTIRNTGAVVHSLDVRPGPEVEVKLSKARKHGGHISRLEASGDARLTVLSVPNEGEPHPPVKFYFSLKFLNAKGQWRQHDYFVNNEDLSIRSAGRGKREGWRNLESRRIRKLGESPWQDN